MIEPQQIVKIEKGFDDVRLECDCNNGEKIELAWDDDDWDDEWRYLWISLVPSRLGLFGRIKAASKMLFSKDPTWGEVLLNKESVQVFADFLDRHKQM